MQTYKTFLRIALKNSPSIITYFIVFMVISIISSSQGQENAKEMYKDEEIRFTVFNRDNSELGEAVKEYLSQKNEYVEVNDDEESIRLALYYRDIYYAVVIPEGFQETIASGKDMEFMNYKVSDTAIGYYMDMDMESYIQTLKSYIASGASMDEAIEKTAKTLGESVKVSLVDNTGDDGIKTNPMTGDLSEKPAHYYFYQYIPYIFLAVVISGLGPIIITFGNKDIKKRINVSAQTFKSYCIQMFLGVVTFGVIVMALFNVLSLVLYGSSIPFAAMMYYLVITLCFLMVCLGIAFLGGFMFSKTATMGAFANVVSLGFSFLGGVFVPLELLGDTMKNIARFTPSYWYIQANNAIIGVKKLSDIDMGEFAKDCGVQLLFALAFFFVGLAVLRHKREEA